MYRKIRILCCLECSVARWFCGPGTDLNLTGSHWFLVVECTGYKRSCSFRQTANDLAKDQKNLHFVNDGFRASVEIHHFPPNKTTAKTIYNQITVEGRHEDRDDGHGSIHRHFLRKYMLPKEYDMSSVHSPLSSDEVLTIKVPPPPALSGSS
ncbi:heat shock protein 27-like [Chironomus tepperi]|uniref:heat shock protein 27-like n=1 Tax=Chironomus tepperi TaxID=113505 RepID=UPI00391FB05E